MNSSVHLPPEDDISEEMISTLVHAFYGRIRTDAELGPIFNTVIGENWDVHLARMCDFWSSVMRMTGRYSGRPMPIHMRLKMVKPEHFSRWLTLFGQTAQQTCPPAIAERFCAKAALIAKSLQLGMFYRPESPRS
jgi:hemoglobin